MDTALQTLVLAAGLAAPSLPPAPVAQGKPAAAPVVEIARLPLQDVAAAQERGAVAKTLSGVPLRLSAAFDQNGESWLLLASGAESKAFALSALGSGAQATLGGLPLTVRAGGDTVTLAARGETFTVSYVDLIRALFAAARHVHPHAVLDYAVVAEDGARGVPASLCLIRVDGDGVFWVTYRSPQQLRAVTWFAAVDGVLKGLARQGDDVVFVEKAIETRK